ncbi:hypothetical protein CARUB_v10021119mg [Capsella rubella]|uniref:Uncharacterized protein n=1 Tax=Capsella rubella TaxID=81985 RepID=R0I622_9BRAS|nr:UPF0540 protein At1g62060 [Capsella rubella]EOA33465.1 hypothetical protein CARUB_v10021119mg [Capsella rubella]
MNATKFAVLLVIGALCVNISASVVSEETKLGTSTPKTATKGIGAELDVTVRTDSYSSGTGYASVTQGRKGPRAASSGNGYTSTSGFVFARGPKAEASSTSGSNARGSAAAAANRNGAASRGDGSASSASTANGRTGSKGRKY